MPALLRASTAPSPGDADAGRGEGLCRAGLVVVEAGGVLPGTGVEEQAASTNAAAMFNARLSASGVQSMAFAPAGYACAAVLCARVRVRLAMEAPRQGYSVAVNRTTGMRRSVALG